MPQIYFQLHHPLQKKHIYNNLKPSPLGRQYKKSTPCKHINFTLPIYFQPSLPPKKPTTLPPPPKKCQRHGSQYIFSPPSPQKNPTNTPPPPNKCQRHESSSSYPSINICNCLIPQKIAHHQKKIFI